MASRLPLIITCALLSGAAGAAELGNARVTSYIGQQLAADIELDMLDAPGGPVQVRLAHPNVYRGANIGMPPVLSTLTMTVMQRDGRQFLRVTSSAPVESSHLHLYVELLDGGQRNVRLATLSMAPNPNPPAPLPPPPPPVLAVPPVPVVAAAPVAAPVVPKPAPPRPRPVPPPRPVVVAKAEPEPVAKPEPKKEAPKSDAIAPPLPLVAVAAPAACAPSNVDQSTVCAALDYKNAQMREQIDALEGRVRVLQVALGASPSEVSKPKLPDPNKPHPARKRPAPEPEAGTPWGMIAAGIGALLALAGAVVVLLRRRKRGGRIPPMPRLPLTMRLRQLFARKKAAEAPVEPKLNEAET